MIYVTSYKQLSEDFRRLQPDYLVSILGPNDRLDWPQLGAPGRRLQIECDDIQYPCSGYIVPTAEHVQRLIDFLKTWNGDGALMIHCKAGTSRSPAAALIAKAIIRPGAEQEAALELRAAAPQARPSQVFLRHADGILGSRLEAAARAMPMPDRIANTDLIKLKIN